MNTFALALRNLLRNRRRSLATLLAMMIGGVCILLFGGYIQNIVYGLQSGYVRGGGHLQIQNRDYALYGSGDPTAYGIADYAHVIAVIKADPVLAPLLTVVTPVLSFGGIAGNFDAGASRTIMASGVVVEDQNAMQTWNDYGFPGKPDIMALTGTRADAAVIGKGVARVLQLCAPLHVEDCPTPPPTTSSGPEIPGDVGALAAADAAQSTASRAEASPGAASPGAAPPGAASAGAASTGTAELELLAATASGAPNVARLKVIKAEAQGVKEFDDVYVGMHLEQAQRLLFGSRAPQVTAILLQLHHTDQIPAAEARLKYLLATTLRGRPLSVSDFRALNPYYGQTLGLFNAIFGFIAILIGGIVLFTVGNTMNAAVVERTVEIGTLRAIGLRRNGIRSLFVSEGMLLGAFGAVAGVGVALILAAIINHSGLTWTPPGRVSPVGLHLRVWGEARLLSSTALVMIMVAVTSAWWPARRAARLQVVEALRHV
jgi:putative ABC transport system permease protein